MLWRSLDLKIINSCNRKSENNSNNIYVLKDYTIPICLVWSTLAFCITSRVYGVRITRFWWVITPPWYAIVVIFIAFIFLAVFWWLTFRKMCRESGTCVADRLAPSHDPVVMGGLSRRGDAPDKPGSSHEGNVDTGYQHLVEGEWMIFSSLPSTLQLELFPWSYSSCLHR